MLTRPETIKMAFCGLRVKTFTDCSCL